VQFSSVARAHPAPAVLGRGILADANSFLGRKGDGGHSQQQTCIDKRIPYAHPDFRA